MFLYVYFLFLPEMAVQIMNLATFGLTTDGYRCCKLFLKFQHRNEDWSKGCVKKRRAGYYRACSKTDNDIFGCLFCVLGTVGVGLLGVDR